MDIYYLKGAHWEMIDKHYGAHLQPSHDKILDATKLKPKIVNSNITLN